LPRDDPSVEIASPAFGILAMTKYVCTLAMPLPLSFRDPRWVEESLTAFITERRRDPSSSLRDGSLLLSLRGALSRAKRGICPEAISNCLRYGIKQRDCFGCLRHPRNDEVYMHPRNDGVGSERQLLSVIQGCYYSLTANLGKQRRS